jgi:hypothetical protein
MWVIVFLTGCTSGETTWLSWSFADHRTCAEANVVTIAVRDGAREVARIACVDEAVALAAERTAGELVVEALGYHGTVLYRGHAVAQAEQTRVTLRYVGGRAD